MAKKSAAGSGSIRKRTLTKNGKQYIYWEARYSAGYDPGTGKQIQRTITGKTQKEVSQKLKAITTSLDNGTYIGSYTYARRGFCICSSVWGCRLICGKGTPRPEN